MQIPPPCLEQGGAVSLGCHLGTGPAMLDCSPFENALAQLEKSLAYLNSAAARNDPELRRQFRAATIQAFEFTYELAMRMIRRQLAEIVVNPAELPQLPFMDFMRTAADAGLVREAPSFRLYREKRNITSHTYSEARAEEVIADLDRFVADMLFVLAELKRRNDATD